MGRGGGGGGAERARSPDPHIRLHGPVWIRGLITEAVLRSLLHMPGSYTRCRRLMTISQGCETNHAPNC